MERARQMGVIRVLVFLVLIGTGCVDVEKRNKGPKGIEHVVMIGVDGLSVQGIMATPTPTLDSLMRVGSYSLKARGVIPTSSGPNWASILMGAGPEAHGVTINSFDPLEPSLPPVASGNGPNGLFPNIFGVIKDQKPAWPLGAIYNWGTIRNYFEEDQVDYDLNPENDEEVERAVSAYSTKHGPRYLFVHFNEVDHAGHSFGHGSEAYLASVRKIDSLIGNIGHSISKGPNASNTLVMVTADHGGLGFGHNENFPEVIDIPFLMAGPSVKSGYEIEMPINTKDNSPTVLYALGLHIPNVWTGKPVKSAFEGFDAKPDYLRGSFNSKPRIQPAGDGFRPSGGLFTDGEATVRIQNNVANAQVLYTRDGSEPAKGATQYEGPFKVKKTTTVKAALFRNGKKISNTSTAYYRLAKPSSGKGVTASIFYGKGLERVPHMEKGTQMAQIDLLEFSSEGFEYPKGPDQLAVGYVGYLKVPVSGEYTFYTESDDGSNLYVNDALVVDNDGNHGVRSRQGTITLDKGKHKIEVTWFNSGGGLWLQTYIKGPGIPKQVLTTDMPNAGMYLTKSK
jgi:hypothetical protein